MLAAASPPVEATASPPSPAVDAVSTAPIETPTPVAPPLAESAPLSEADPAPSDDIIVSGRHEAPKEDPLEGVNYTSYQAVQAVDVAIVAPVAMGYKSAIPKPVRHGIRNFINNLDEPVAALAFLLQLKPGKAAETIGRFGINSTIGLGGLIDVAKKKPFNLPRRYNGLANTLGYYGVGPGPFLFLPGIGPTTARDLVGRIVDFSILPRLVGKPLTSPAFSIGKATLGALTDRIERDVQIRALRDRSDDGYGAIRKDYLERRQAEIDALRGRSKPASEPAPLEPIPE
jgi:phospholipid-binding lipoprotein MlaA